MTVKMTMTLEEMRERRGEQSAEKRRVEVSWQDDVCE
jgi:hypothetical protein